MKTFNDNTTQNYSTSQGKQYLRGYQAKKARFSNTLLGEGSPNAFNKEHSTRDVIEGFTGAFGESQVNIKNANDAKKVEARRIQFDRAMSNYAGAQKQLMEEVQTFVNNSTNEGPATKLKNQFIKTSKGQLGFVTDTNTFKYIPNSKVMNSLMSNNGCPAQLNESNLTPDAIVPGQGSVTNTDPNLFVGKPMRENQSCAPSAINLQVMGQTDPKFNKAEWLGCYKNISSKFDYNADLPISEDPEQCRIRSADQGSSAFYINQGKCYTSKNGITVEDIKNTGSLATKPLVSQVIFETDSVGPNGAFGIMNNGQFALGNLPDGANTYGENVKNPQMWEGISGLEGCDSRKGGSITVTGATWGSNCDGQVKPWTMY